MRFGVALEGEISVTDDDGKPVVDAGALIEAHLDDVMDELLKLDADDAMVDLDLENDNSVRFSVSFEAVNPIVAIQEASGMIRTAIHAAGGATPDWPNEHDEAWAVRLVRAESTELVSA